MPVIKVVGMDVFLAGLHHGLKRIRDELPERYKEALEKVAGDIRRDAVSALSKPSWLLSKYLERKVKTYKDGRFLFGVVQPKGPRSAPKNTPAFYAWYQEHGYHVSLTQVKRVTKSRLVYGKNRKKRGGVPTGYRRQEGHHFLKTAFEQHKKDLLDAINRINETIDKKIQEEIRR